MGKNVFFIFRLYTNLTPLVCLSVDLYAWVVLSTCFTELVFSNVIIDWQKGTLMELGHMKLDQRHIGVQRSTDCGRGPANHTSIFMDKVGGEIKQTHYYTLFMYFLILLFIVLFESIHICFVSGRQ